MLAGKKTDAYGIDVLFQRKDGYGKGCPWSCAHARRDISYENLELPETRRWLKEYALIRQ